LQAAIHDFLLAWNQNPCPFIWTATVESIQENSLGAVKRWSRSSRLHQPKSRQRKKVTV
jgi:hypothetical protein